MSESDTDQIVNLMKFDVKTFKVQKHVNIDDPTKVKLLLRNSDSVDNLKKYIAKHSETIEGTPFRLTDWMEAKLVGKMFQFTEITPAIQTVSSDDETEWIWEVHPTKEGKHRLHLAIMAHIEVGREKHGRNERRPVFIKPPLEEEIEVTVKATQKARLFFENNWQWLWASVLIPIFAWIQKKNS